MISRLATLRAHQRVNKLPGARVLTDKAQLCWCLHRMREAHGEQVYDFAPQSFVLPEEAEIYEEWLRERFAEGRADSWILKPAAASRGNGIFLHKPTLRVGKSNLDGIYPSSVQKHVGVACRYIDRAPPKSRLLALWITLLLPSCARGWPLIQRSNHTPLPALAAPLLLDGLKFDLRLYVLVTSVHPLVFYLYNEGLVRFATEPYDAVATANGDGLERQCRHLTNVSIAKKSKEYVKSTDGGAGESEGRAASKWSLGALRTRFVLELGEARAGQFWNDLDSLVVKTLCAAEPQLNAAMRSAVPAADRGERVRQCFQIFGFDVMPDAAAKPWLLEVNCDPQMTIDSPLDLRIKSAMLVNALNVVGMPMPPAEADAGAGATSGGSGSGASLAPTPIHHSPDHAEEREGREQATLRDVNAELVRSQGSGWRRLLPSACSSSGYRPLLAAERSLNWLPFDT